MNEKFLNMIEQMNDVKDRWENGIITDHEANFQMLPILNDFFTKDFQQVLKEI